MIQLAKPTKGVVTPRAFFLLLLSLVALRAEFAGELFTAGGLLDASRYYIILPDEVRALHRRSVQVCGGGRVYILGEDAL